MEILSAVTLIASPFIITLLTNLVKKIEKINLAENRTFLLRFIAATLSFAAVIVSALMNHTQVDPSIIQTFAEAIIVFIGSTGIYFWNKYRKIQG